MLEELTKANEYIVNKIEKYVEMNEILREIETSSLENNVPIISKETAEFIKFLIRSNKNIKNVLEIGTATGYSGITMLNEIINRNGFLTSIEIDEKRYGEAKLNFQKMKIDEKNYNLILGDASLEIEKLNQKYDFIFIDAAKGQYKNFFEKSFQLLNDGGLIFIDNILFRGYIYKEIPKRYKTIVKNLDEFIDFLYENYNFTLLPFSDGIGLVYKESRKEL